jgi:DNA-binding response OmpR family regulator
VTLNEVPIHLTRNEFKLLTFMARSPGQVFSREQLMEALHGYAYESYDRSIDSHIKNLRRKLEWSNSSPILIQTVYGIGYKFSPEEQV